MRQYLDLVQHILDNGTWQQNRTGVRTCSLPGAMLRFDLQQGFPAITTKKIGRAHV
jgi:thymidylate synthase